MPLIQIDVNDLPAQLTNIVAQAEAGDEVVVTQNGSPMVKLSPIVVAKKPRVFGLHPGAMVMAPDFDDPLPDEFWLGES